MKWRDAVSDLIERANTGKGRYARLIRAAQAVVETNAPSIKALGALRDALAQIQKK
jgi:hypothetical protein